MFSKLAFLVYSQLMEIILELSLSIQNGKFYFVFIPVVRFNISFNIPLINLLPGAQHRHQPYPAVDIQDTQALQQSANHAQSHVHRSRTLRRVNRPPWR